MSAPKKSAATVPTNPQKQVWKEVDHSSYYSNIMQVALSPFDISIVFGKVLNADDKAVVCGPLATVTLAPEQAANLMQMLAASLQGFVHQFGDLRATAAFKLGTVEKEEVLK